MTLRGFQPQSQRLRMHGQQGKNIHLKTCSFRSQTCHTKVIYPLKEPNLRMMIESLWLNNDPSASDNTQADTSEINSLVSNSSLPSDQQPTNNIPTISSQASRQPSQTPSYETLETQDITDSEQHEHNINETVYTRSKLSIRLNYT